MAGLEFLRGTCGAEHPTGNEAALTHTSSARPSYTCTKMLDTIFDACRRLAVYPAATLPVEHARRREEESGLPACCKVCIKYEKRGDDI